MSTVDLAMPEAGATDQQTLKNLMDTLMKYRKELQYLLTHLDDNNISKITAKSIDTSTLLVGENIFLAEGASIAWEDVSGRPNTTHIDAYGVYTGTVQADQIFAGVLTGFTIKTAASGQRMMFYSNGIESYDSSNDYHGLMAAIGYPNIDLYNHGNQVFGLSYSPGDAKMHMSGDYGAFLYTDGNLSEPKGLWDFADASVYNLPSTDVYWSDIIGNVFDMYDPSDFAYAWHTHGNSYVKTNGSQNIEIVFFEGASENFFEVYKSGSYMGSFALY